MSSTETTAPAGTLTATPRRPHTPPHTPPRAQPSAGPRTLDAVFAAAARDWPCAVAVRDDAGALTYGRAQARATQLATALVRRGVQLGDPVVVHCQDHRQTLVAHLAVLRAGAVCVPVPGELRGPALRRIAELSGAPQVLCSAATRPRWQHRADALVLDDDATWTRINALRPDPSLPRSGPTDAAYLLIADPRGPDTRGHLVDHRAFGFCADARTAALGGPAGRVAVRQAPGGQRALSAMWWAFAGGGALLGRGDDAALLESLTGGGTRSAVLSAGEYTAVLDLLARAPRPAGPRGGPGSVVLLGAPCPDELARRHFDLLPGTRLLAEFAPVDGVMPWTARELTAHDAPSGAGHAVGAVLPHVRARVQDPDGRPLAAGHSGEVCATGAALPFDTVSPPDRAFTPGEAAGSLLRSGRLGRLAPDGALHLLDPLNCRSGAAR